MGRNGCALYIRIINDLKSKSTDEVIDFVYNLVIEDYNKKLEDIPEEMVEMLFISLIDVEYNTKNLNIDNIKFLGTCSGIENSKSFYTLLSYGNASKIINKTIKGKYTFKDDIMTETVLGLLLNNKLDENNN